MLSKKIFFTNSVGKLIVTKAVGYLSDDAENDFQV